MRADPHPCAAFFVGDAERAMVEADADRPEGADALEVQRRVTRVGLEQVKVLACESLNGW